MESFHSYPDKLVQIKIKGFKLLLVTCTCLLLSVLHSNKQQNSDLYKLQYNAENTMLVFKRKKKSENKIWKKGFF